MWRLEDGKGGLNATSSPFTSRRRATQGRYNGLQYTIRMRYSGIGAGIVCPRSFSCVPVRPISQIYTSASGFHPPHGSLIALLQQIRLPLIQIQDHLPKQSVRSREPMSRSIIHIEGVDALMDQPKTIRTAHDATLRAKLANISHGWQVSKRLDS
jgi:hypothetical protein